VFHVVFDEVSGRRIESVRVRDLDAEDLEAIETGSCPSSTATDPESCLYLADLGNNALNRKALRIIVVPEKETYRDSVKARTVFNVTYAKDGRGGSSDHNTEAVMIDPRSGDIYAITKRSSPHSKHGVENDLNPRLYVLRRREYASPGLNSPKEVEVVFRFLRTLPFDEIFPEMAESSGKERKRFLVTDASFSPSGRRFAILTLGGITEFASSALESKEPFAAADFRRVPREVAPPLEQQEALAYTNDGLSLIYTSEKKNKKRRRKEATEVHRIDCVQ
jgi:hypothetical protein